MPPVKNLPAKTSVDVAIVGAGPVGLMIANTLGLYGVSALVVEKLDKLIDYPRAIGLDDESFRTFQAVGLADELLPHTTPNHWMRFVTANGRVFASIEPRTDEFGWSRRNAFMQPLADEILYRGLARFPQVSVQFGQSLSSFTQDANGVTLTLEDEKGAMREVRAGYLVGADGGNSIVRRTLNVSFEGRTKPNKWIVVDVRNDPLGTPHIYLHCDPERPYVSAALPHGIRRFEFMVMPGETEEELSKPENLAAMMRKVVPNPEKVDYIRKRVYTHNARLAGEFRVGRVLLAGDAAHIMPVWQGQGYNSGMRDASNLAWKLALVAKGLANEALLETYGMERRAHARSMIHLSEVAGDIFAPESLRAAKIRDAVTLALNAVPAVKQYFVEMRFKPMPRYESGALVLPERKDNVTPMARLLDKSGDTAFGRLIGLMSEKKESLIGRLVHGLDVPENTPVGRMFIQPKVTTEDGRTVLLDDVVGVNFAIIAWGTDPTYGMTPEALAAWQKLGARFIRAKPATQLPVRESANNGVITVGDTTGRLKDWFSDQTQSVVFLRPDRFVAALSSPQTVTETTAALMKALAASSESSMSLQLECLSHTPLHGYYDPAPDIVAEVERAQAAARARVEAFDPELVVLFAPDHYNGQFYDLMPAFAIGVEARAIGDFKSLAGPLAVPKEVSLACAQHVLDSGVDLAVSYRMQVDHGFAQALEVLTGGLDRYPVLPVFINSVAPPMAPCRRVRILGDAIGRFTAQLGKRVLIVGSGGISHEPPVPDIATATPEVAERLIAGRNPSAQDREARQARTIAAAQSFVAGTSGMHALNPEWDKAFLGLLADGRVDVVDTFTDAWITENGGKSAHEIRTWIAAFAALAAAGPYEATLEYYRPIKEWIAGFAVMQARNTH